MKNTLITKQILVVAASMLLSVAVFAQGDKASRPSPPATATGKIGAATITINYSSPSVKGRPVWTTATLAPYGKPWRLGANEATIFETDKEVKIEGKTLAAGKYSLFAIPGEKEWTFIFNSETGQWGIKRSGEANFDPTKNVLSVTAKPAKSAKLTEKLAFDVTASGFVFHWENVEVPVSIK